MYSLTSRNCFAGTRGRLWLRTSVFFLFFLLWLFCLFINFCLFLLFFFYSNDIDTSRAARLILMNDNHCSRRPVEAAATTKVTGAVRLRQLLHQQRQSGGDSDLHSLVDRTPHPAISLTMKADHPDSGRAQPVVDCRLPPYWLQSVNNIPWPFIPQVGSVLLSPTTMFNLFNQVFC